MPGVDLHVLHILWIEYEEDWDDWLCQGWLWVQPTSVLYNSSVGCSAQIDSMIKESWGYQYPFSKTIAPQSKNIAFQNYYIHISS